MVQTSRPVFVVVVVVVTLLLCCVLIFFNQCGGTAINKNNVTNSVACMMCVASYLLKCAPGNSCFISLFCKKPLYSEPAAQE